MIENMVPMAAEIYLALMTLAFLLFGVYRHTRVTMPMIVATAVLLSFTMLLLARADAMPLVTMNGMFIADGFAAFVKILILLGTLLTLFISADWLTEDGGKPFEYLLLMLLATLGMMLMVSANSLLSVYMALELSSLALYVLAAFERDSERSAEAGLKYFVLGSLASGMMLFGMSLVYGSTGTIDFDTLGAQMATFADEAGGGAAVPPMLVTGLVMVIIGLCFKVAAVPFHMWAPDVYEGAPTPVTAFFASAPKIAAFGLMARLLLQPFADLLPQWQQVIAFASLASMLVGALAALRQTNIKRLLAYSSIGHAGFVLMGLAAGTDEGAQALLIYLAIYLFMGTASWACVLLMRKDGKYVEQISDLSGLYQTRPWLAFALAACMFSMIGIPPFAGFFGKFYVIRAAAQAGLMPLVVAGLLTSVISCYYYLRVVKFMYFDEPDGKLDRGMTPPMRVGLVVSVAVISLFCIIPAPLLVHARAAASLLSQ